MSKPSSRIAQTALWLCGLLVLSACNGPFMMLPGGALTGPETPLPPAATDGGTIVLETRPAKPYSVIVGYTVRDGQYYIDPAAERTWYQHLASDPRLRVRLEGAEAIHPALVETVTDPAILANFDPERIVLRIVPRS